MPKYTEAEVREAVSTSLNLTEVLRKLGLRPAGGNHAQLKKYLELWQISIAHFDPNAGRVVAFNHESIPLSDVMVEHSTYSRSSLKRRLYDAGLKQRECELCGQGETWRGKSMGLILDHINGVADDNRLENIRIVCPNCNSTLDTHCGRKNLRPPRTCLRCGKPFKPLRGAQRYCSGDCGQRYDRGILRPETRKVERPTHEVLMRELAETNYSAVGRKYGVSDNAVRKWARAYEYQQQRAAEVAAAAEVGEAEANDADANAGADTGPPDALAA